jgi:hypothetical protein
VINGAVKGCQSAIARWPGVDLRGYEMARVSVSLHIDRRSVILAECDGNVMQRGSFSGESGPCGHGRADAYAARAGEPPHFSTNCPPPLRSLGPLSPCIALHVGLGYAAVLSFCVPLLRYSAPADAIVPCHVATGSSPMRQELDWMADGCPIQRVNQGESASIPLHCRSAGFAAPSP